jgi:hypothetical protein
MNQPLSTDDSPAPRRFILLPEESVEGDDQGPRIRRFQLSSVGRRSGLNGVDVASARIAREFARIGSM